MGLLDGAGDIGLVRYICVDPSHAEPREAGTGPFTVHAREWAYCPARDATALADHRWEPLAGVTFRTQEDLERYIARRRER